VHFSVVQKMAVDTMSNVLEEIILTKLLSLVHCITGDWSKTEFPVVLTKKNGSPR